MASNFNIVIEGNTLYPKDGIKVKAFYEMYTKFCALAGVSLQDPQEASADKAYGITHCGNMLGVWFNTRSWRWWIAEDKVSRYVNDLNDILHSQSVKQHGPPVTSKCLSRGDHGQGSVHIHSQFGNCEVVCERPFGSV